MSFPYKEDLLQFIWQNQLIETNGLKTEDGKPIKVINAGYLNLTSGPDFSNAAVAIDGTIFHGSVEIHLKSADWSNHKHQYDKAYNNVILHVCYEQNKEVQREDGTLIPTLVLKDRLKKRHLQLYQELMSRQSFIPCDKLIHTVSKFEIDNWKERVLIDRLEMRCQDLQERLVKSKDNWNQAFYLTLLRAFGMPNNSDCFEEIGERVPIETIIKHHKSIFQLEALFFGAAGLLEEESGDHYYVSLRSEFLFLQTKYKIHTISSQMKFGRMRPMNSPYVRLAQLAALFHHKPRFVHLVLALPDINEIKKGLNFNLSSYWDTHYSFKKESPKRDKTISTSLLNHLLLNAIVPFVFYYQKTKLAEDNYTALEYLEHIPREKNKITEQWKSLGVNSKSAAESQALLHLYKHYCKPKRCLNCNIGKSLLVKSTDGSV